MPPILSTSALSLHQTSHAEGEECLSAFYGPLFVIQTSFLSLSQGSSFSRWGQILFFFLSNPLSLSCKLSSTNKTKIGMCTLAGAERLFLPLSVSVKGSEGFSERWALCTGLHSNTFQVFCGGACVRDISNDIEAQKNYLKERRILQAEPCGR